MRQDMVIALLKAGLSADSALVRTIALQMMAGERRAEHTTLADRIETVIESASAAGSKQHLASKAGPLLAEMRPARTLGQMTLTPATRLCIERFIAEQRSSERLAEHGLRPRRTMLLVGAPGNGKTCLAGAIAQALDRPLLAIRYETLIGSYLGETGARLAQVFEHAGATRCVLLLDEADALARSRNEPHETGEIKRVVNMLLLQIDAMAAHAIVIGATNDPGAIDRAAWRRFEVALSLDEPDSREKTRYLVATIEHYGVQWATETTPETFIARVEPRSFAETEALALDLARETVLDGPKRVVDITIDRVLTAWAARENARARAQ